MFDFIRRCIKDRRMTLTVFNRMPLRHFRFETIPAGGILSRHCLEFDVSLTMLVEHYRPALCLCQGLPETCQVASRGMLGIRPTRIWGSLWAAWNDT